MITSLRGRIVAISALFLGILIGWYVFVNHRPKHRAVEMPYGYYCVTYVDINGNESECIPKPSEHLPFIVSPDRPAAVPCDQGLSAKNKEILCGEK
jgi:hypothetical protein